MTERTSRCKFCRKPFKRKVRRISSVKTRDFPDGFPIVKIYCSYQCSRYDAYWRSHMPIWLVRLHMWLTFKYHWLMRIP